MVIFAPKLREDKRQKENYKIFMEIASSPPADGSWQ